MMMALVMAMAAAPSLAFMAQHSVPLQSLTIRPTTTKLFVGMPLDPNFNLTTIGIPTPYRNEQERKEYQPETTPKRKKLRSSVAVAERDTTYTTTSHSDTSTGWSSGVVPEGVEEDDYVQKTSGTFNFLVGLGALNAALLVVLLGTAIFNPSPAVVVDKAAATSTVTSIEKTQPATTTTSSEENEMDDLNWITGSWEILND